MDKTERSVRFDDYVGKLAVGLGHADRHEPFKSYCLGLLLPGERKSVEPLAALTDPSRVSAKHQSLLHFVGKAPWSDDAMLRDVRRYVLPRLLDHGPMQAWVLDDTGIPKKGKHSVGVKNQYCGVLGKNANCQVAVSLSVANQHGSLPVAYRLYLPEIWSNDSERRRKCGVPDDIAFHKKWQIGLQQIREVLDQPDVERAPVVADAGYGDTVDFRDGLTSLGVPYAVGVSKTTTVWRPDQEPLPAKAYSGRGRPPKLLRRSEDHKPVNALELARELPASQWHDVPWCEGSRGDMTSRFAALRARPAHRDTHLSEPRPTEWLLIEWPADEPEPTKYWLSTLPADTTVANLVCVAKVRWRIERDYRELKDEIGLDHYEGRSWRGFHHHGTLCIAAYGFLIAERARLSPPDDGAPSRLPAPAVPESHRPRGAASPH